MEFIMLSTLMGTRGSCDNEAEDEDEDGDGAAAGCAPAFWEFIETSVIASKHRNAHV